MKCRKTVKMMTLKKVMMYCNKVACKLQRKILIMTMMRVGVCKPTMKCRAHRSASRWVSQALSCLRWFSFWYLYLDMICGCFFDGYDMNFWDVWTLICYICDIVIFVIHVVIFDTGYDTVILLWYKCINCIVRIESIGDNQSWADLTLPSLAWPGLRTPAKPEVAFSLGRGWQPRSRIRVKTKGLWTHRVKTFMTGVSNHDRKVKTYLTNGVGNPPLKKLVKNIYYSTGVGNPDRTKRPSTAASVPC